MFERYTEKARRVIFFARYESSHYGTPAIEAEHILLGLLREDKHLCNRTLSFGAVEAIRKAIDARFPAAKNIIPTSVDLPLSEESKQVLIGAAEEADQLGHKYIGTEHLQLSLLRDKGSFSAGLLRQHGLDLDEQRRKMTGLSGSHSVTGPTYVKRSNTVQETVDIHGSAWNVDYIRDAVQKSSAHSWHWQLRPWVPLDVVIHRVSGKVSFDLSLAQDAVNFDLLRGGWKQGHCAICRWRILESEEPAHNSGYTNGREWVCIECYEKFFRGQDYFSSNHPEIT